jgi:hypothetical protein
MFCAWKALDRLLRKAGETCGARAYNIWNQATGQSAVLTGSEDSVFGSSSEERTLLIGVSRQPC